MYVLVIDPVTAFMHMPTIEAEISTSVMICSF
jgi:hypothetical protein